MERLSQSLGSPLGDTDGKILGLSHGLTLDTKGRVLGPSLGTILGFGESLGSPLGDELGSILGLSIGIFARR